MISTAKVIKDVKNRLGGGDNHLLYIYINIHDI